MIIRPGTDLPLDQLFDILSNLSMNRSLNHSLDLSLDLSLDRSLDLSLMGSMNGPMTCYTCGRSITSQHHHEHCNTVMMWEQQTVSIDDITKPFMTYGLGGCTAVIIYNKTKNTFTMAHDPSVPVIAGIITKHQNDDITLYSRTPNRWLRDDSGKFTSKLDENIPGLEHFKNFPNIKWIKSFYSGLSIFNNYETSMYAKYVNGQLMCTDEWGCWKSLI